MRYSWTTDPGLGVFLLVMIFTAIVALLVYYFWVRDDDD